MEVPVKKFFITAVSCLLIGSTQLSAASWDCCDPCYSESCDPCCDWDFCVYADYLYWKLCQGSLEYIDNEDVLHHLEPGYNSGWRVGGRIGCGAWDVGAR